MNSSQVVQFSYTNTLGSTYYLHKTNGKGTSVIYYFSKTPNPQKAVYDLPADREVSELRNSNLPTLIKKSPKSA